MPAERAEQRQREAADDGASVGVGEQRFAVLALERDELANRERERTLGVGSESAASESESDSVPSLQTHEG